MDCDHLILVALVPDNTLDQYVEWSAQEYVISRVPNDMELYILHDVSDEDWQVAGEAQSLINFTVCRLHVETDMRVVDEGQRMTWR